MERKLCNVKVDFKFGDEKCRMIHVGRHSHNQYIAKHLTVAEVRLLDKKVEEEPHSKPSKAVVGVSSRTGEVIPPIYESVSKILINKDRTKYELGNSKRRMAITSSGSFLGEFGE